MDRDRWVSEHREDRAACGGECSCPAFLHGFKDKSAQLGGRGINARTVAFLQKTAKKRDNILFVSRAFCLAEIGLNGSTRRTGVKAKAEHNYKSVTSGQVHKKTHLITFKRPPSAGSGPPTSNVAFIPLCWQIKSKSGCTTPTRPSIHLAQAIRQGM